jgi:hypothetical protein
MSLVKIDNIYWNLNSAINFIVDTRSNGEKYIQLLFPERRYLSIDDNLHPDAYNIIMNFIQSNEIQSVEINPIK